MLLFKLLVLPSFVHALWPIPHTLQTGTSLLKLSPTFDITLPSISKPPQDLLAAIAQTKTYLHTDKLQRLIVGRGAASSTGLQTARALPSLTLSLLNNATPHAIAVEAVRPIGMRNEGYTLSVPADGSPAVLTANSTLGLFRGLTTFGQLWYDLEGVTYSYEAPIKIAKDVPAFPYRGFMLDTARNFFPVADIKRTLDAMSWVKMSTFHWHAVDSQSFPLDILGFRELASKGAYSQSEIYTTADIQDIVSYAGARGIDVLVELDTPGHTASISSSHPEHIACPLSTPWPSFAAEPPSGQLRLASAATTTFTSSFIRALASTLPSTLFSTGGDEVNLNCYAKDAQTQMDLKASGKTLEQALSAFVGAVHKALGEVGKTPVVWEEMVLEHNITLSKDTVVMVWISSQHAGSVAAKNFRIVHAPSDYFYLDCGAGEWLGNNPSGNSWCDPFKTWQKSYTFDPLASLTTAQHALVLGGQQLLWTEQSSPENLDSIVWPRAASSAEVFWTGATLPDGTPRSAGLASALPRLHDLRYRMVRRGVRAIALQPHWCALRPGACDG
ncbi:Beta-hexosaminidase 2 [Hypsizygus marmoreus]|uniref:Beta-hexosaminidase n=1 Tax=Hypsizygus marmoreus TaxID=39966 RepID=A0A369JF22_HYPMA|nr:Beta-hexosaminidase 2 [Hypsizygus marmoreus]